MLTGADFIILVEAELRGRPICLQLQAYGSSMSLDHGDALLMQPCLFLTQWNWPWWECEKEKKALHVKSNVYFYKIGYAKHLKKRKSNV